MKKDAADVTLGELLRLLSYNKLTGLLTWKVNRSRKAKAGDEAGAITHTGMVLVGIQGKSYPAARLIWFYVTSAWPRGRLRFKDNDPTNLRWNNLTEELPNLSTRRVNIYQRKRRYVDKLALERIAASELLSSIFSNPNDPRAPGVLHDMRADVADDLARNNIDPAFRPAHMRRKRTQRATP